MAITAWGKGDREALKISELQNEGLAQENMLLKQQLMIAQHASPYIPQERPREGVGGTNEHPFDDFGNDRNPPVINPATGKPEWAGTSQGLKIAHGEGRGPQPLYHDEYNRPLDMPPWIQMFPDGQMREIPWMKEKYLNEHPELASGPDYIGDKLRYGQLDRILNPHGTFQRPTLDQLRIHARNYPTKA